MGRPVPRTPPQRKDISVMVKRYHSKGDRREMKTLLRMLTVGLIVAAPVSAAGQAGSTAQISGTVRDSSGGVLPGVDVTATQTDTNFTRSTVTDAEGNYVLSNLPIGPYRLRAALSGFRSFEQTGIVLTVNANPTIPIELGLGELTETVSVEAAAPLVETRNPSIGQVMENERVEELPLNGRNPVELISLVGAAVRPEGAAGLASSRSMQGGQAIAVAGGQSYGVAYLLDGAMHNNPYDNLNLPLPFPDAMQEFRVETSAQNAQNGFHSGASVNIATKSGTNLFRGDLFEFYRNHRFNATNPFNLRDPATGERRGDGLNRNQFGGTLGGPIQTDRMFFFGAYQGTNTDEAPADLIAFVPTPAMLAGDFTQFASAACNTGGAVTLGAPFVNNRVDPSQLSPAAVRIAGRLPQTSDPCGRVNYSRQTKPREIQGIGKLDFQFTPNHSLFGRYMATTYKYEPPFSASDNILTTTLGGRDNLAQSLAIGDTQVLTNNLVNNLRFAFNRTSIHRTHTNFFGVNDVGVNTYSYLDDYMLLGVTGGFNVGGGTENEATFKTNSYSISDDLTWVRGNHQFGFGTNLAFWDSLSLANVRSPGTFNFDGGATGLGLADFLTGRLNTFIQSAPNTLDMTQWYFGLYAQDTWKLNQNMTLNYGLRWEPWFPQQHQNGAIYNFSPDAFRAGVRSTVFPGAPPGFTYPGDTGFLNGKAGMDKNWLAFAPRVGFAWDPKGDGRQSVRVGYALANEFVNAQFFINTANAPPWGSEVRLTRPAGGFDDPFAGSAVRNIFPVTFDQNAAFSLNGPYLVPPSELNNTKVHSWNVSFQQQLGDSTAVSASYIGNYTQNLWDVVTGNPGGFYGTGACTLNTLTGPQTFANCGTPATLDVRRELYQANPGTGQYIGFLDYYTDFGHQQYNGLLLSVQRRLSSGFSANANYTLSKCEGHPSQGGTTPNVASGYMLPVSLINPPADAEARLDESFGPCDTDRRHLFNLTATVETPQFEGAALRAIASGWRLSGIFRAASGAPLTVTTGVDRALSGNQGVQRANQVLDDPYGARTLDNWLNPAAFAQPDLGTYGNSKRNAYQGPGSRTVDLSLVRSFRFLNTHRVEARVEAFNAFNWFRWGTPITARINPNFGRILSAGDPRIMQFALKYQF
jgi:hypothetical protein